MKGLCFVFANSTDRSSGGILVLLALNSLNDRNQQFIDERGLNGVPHIAIRVNDIYQAAETWRNKGFIP